MCSRGKSTHHSLSWRRGGHQRQYWCCVEEIRLFPMQVTLNQWFSTFVGPRPVNSFFYKTRARYWAAARQLRNTALMIRCSTRRLFTIPAKLLVSSLLHKAFLTWRHPSVEWIPQYLLKNTETTTFYNLCQWFSTLQFAFHRSQSHRGKKLPFSEVKFYKHDHSSIIKWLLEGSENCNYSGV
jgi:hypothetical protein